MKVILIKIFWPILMNFEKGEEKYTYKPLNRTILIVLGLLFLVLAMGVAWVVVNAQNWGGLLPVIVFGTVGFVCVVVGMLGSERAVAKIWSAKKLS